jgi:phenylacetate-CoA ligase
LHDRFAAYAFTLRAVEIGKQKAADLTEMKHLLDIARGAYSHLPPHTRSHVSRFLRLIPEDLKWGSTYREWRELLARAEKNPPLVHKRQHRARLAVLTIAAERSPFYRALFKEVFSGKFEAVQWLDDANWAQIPILTSTSVVDRARDMCTRPFNELDTGSTGGTSGKPIKFYLDKHRSPIEYAFVHDAWARAGFRPGDPRCVFRGVELNGSREPHMQYDPALAELRCSVFHLNDATMLGYHREILARRIRFIHGYPSAIAGFASFLLRTGLAPLKQIEGVFPTSERFNAGHCEIVGRAFERATIVPFYGLSEKVAFACARPDDSDAFEFNPLYGFTELLDENGSAVTTPGDTGRIVSTGLLFHGMPFIRYETGDSARLVELPTETNGYRLTVRDINPKHGIEYLLGRSEILIALKGLISNLQGTAYGIREYQFYQDTPGEAVVRIVPLSWTAADFSAYEDLLNRKMAGELRVKVDVVDHVAITPRGKRKLVVQRLDLTRLMNQIKMHS